MRNEVKINGLTWKVIFFNYTEETRKLELGTTKYLDLTLNIRKDIREDIMKTTIVHEVIHAFLCSLGFRVAEDGDAMLFSEEQVCEFMAMNYKSINNTCNKIYKMYREIVK